MTASSYIELGRFGLVYLLSLAVEFNMEYAESIARNSVDFCFK
jgi:hypothetical protein